ncbi:MAG: hypothetical protein M3R24_11970, partial [Chloroflexota bacterium]|nr:hypothetical protein [Chloroflexota bacterium]
MRELSTPLRRYILVVYAFTAVFVLFCSQIQSQYQYSYLDLGLFAVLAIVTELRVTSYSQSYQQTVTTAIIVASFFIFDPMMVVLIAVPGTVICDIYLSKSWYRIIFNICVRVIPFGIASSLIYIMNVDALSSISYISFLQIFAVFVVYLILSTIILGILFALLKGRSVFGGWSESLAILNPYDLALFPYGLVLAWLWHSNPLYFFIGLIPLVAIQHAFSVHAGLLKEQEASMRLTSQQRQIHEATTTLLSSTDIHSQLDTMMRYIMEVFPVSRASVLLWGEGSEPDQVVSRGTSSPDLPIKDWGENLRRVSESRRLVQL